MMKKTVLLLLGIFISIMHADDLEWAESYQEALNSAKSSGKIVMVFFEMEGCPACEYMRDVAFDNSAVSGYIETNFVPVAFDIHDKNAPEGLKPYGSPTIYFIDGNGQRIGRQLVGGMTAPNFLKELKKYKAMSTK